MTGDPGWQLRTAVFLSSQTLSLFGSSLVQFALIWYIARTTNSGMMVTLSTICAFLPQLLVSLFAGVWADRYDRAAWGGFRNRIVTLAVGNCAFGALTLAIGLIKLFALYLAIMALAGMTMPLFSTPTMTLFQEKVPGDKQGRVFGLFRLVNTGIMLVGMAVFGPLADVVRIETLMIVTGALLLLQGLSVFRNEPFLREGMRPELPGTASGPGVD